MEIDKTTGRYVFHQSDLNKFERCGWQFYLENIEHRRGQRTRYHLRGSALHKSREVNFRQKIASGNDLPCSDLLDAARDTIVSSMQDGGVQMSGDLEGKTAGDAMNIILHETLPLVEVDREVLMPDLQPAIVEQPVAVTLPKQSFDLGGRIDLITKQSHIIDAKTSKKRWTQQQADTEYQATHYWILAGAALESAPRAFCYDILLIKKRGNDAYRLPTQRTNADVAALIERYKSMEQAIRKGMFVPSHRSNWWCSPVWCAQWNNCKYVGHGERK